MQHFKYSTPSSSWAKLTKTIFGTKIEIKFWGYEDDKGFHIESFEWDKPKYTDLQNRMLEDYIDCHSDEYEEEINRYEPEM